MPFSGNLVVDVVMALDRDKDYLLFMDTNKDFNIIVCNTVQQHLHNTTMEVESFADFIQKYDGNLGDSASDKIKALYDKSNMVLNIYFIPENDGWRKHAEDIKAKFDHPKFHNLVTCALNDPR